MSLSGRPVVVGEVLFDMFPDGSRVLGGAPFNVAWHLQAFGAEPVMITRVGEDTPGTEVLGAMEAWGMDRTGVQRGPSHPTGTVQVSLKEGEPSFDIVADQAYDHTAPDEALQVLQGLDLSLIYHGSLFLRSAAARSVLDAIREQMSLPAFVDVNLRSPWWDLREVRSMLSAARWAKLNENELVQLGSNAGDPDVNAREILRDHDLETLIVTRGADGASVLVSDRSDSASPSTLGEVVDTVGAGDAFSAVCILGLTHGWSAAQMLDRALQFAAEICSVRGATTNDREVYDRFAKDWGTADA